MRRLLRAKRDHVVPQFRNSWRWCGLFALAVMALATAPVERAHGQTNLLLAAGEVGDSYHALGVGLMSLVKVTLLHDQGIDLSLVEEASADRRWEMIQAGAVDMALLSDDDLQRLPGAGRLGLVSRFSLTSDNGAKGATISLVANNGLDGSLVESLTTAIVEEERWLSGALPGLSRLSPEQAANVALPWHEGALAYYKTQYPNLETGGAVASGIPDIFVIYLGDQGAASDEEATRQIDLACSHATKQGAATVLVSGPDDLMRLDESGIRLRDVRAQAILDQLRAREGCRYASIDQDPDNKTFSERYAPDIPLSVQRRLEVAVILNR